MRPRLLSDNDYDIDGKIALAYSQLISNGTVHPILIETPRIQVSNRLFKNSLERFSILEGDFFSADYDISSDIESIPGCPALKEDSDKIDYQRVFLSLAGLSPYISTRYFGCPTLFLDDVCKETQEINAIVIDDSAALANLLQHRILEDYEIRNLVRRARVLVKQRRQSSNEYRFLQNAVVSHNLQFIARSAARYKTSSFSLNERIQYGVAGAIRGFEKYDPDRPAQEAFLTFASWHIRQQITRAIADEERTIRVPVHLHETYSKIRKSARKYGSADDLIESEVHIKKESRDRIAAAFQPIVSLDTSLKDSESTMYDLLGGVVNLEQQVISNDSKRLVESVVSGLNEKESEVISLRFGLVDGIPRTLDEIGKRYGVTRERIRQIENKAMKRLKLPSRCEKLRGLYDGT